MVQTKNNNVQVGQKIVTESNLSSGTSYLLLVMVSWRTVFKLEAYKHSHISSCLCVLETFHFYWHGGQGLLLEPGGR